MIKYLLHTTKKLPLVVICPGGAYEWRSTVESEPVAKAFNANGYHAVIADYTVAESEMHDRPLLDLCDVIKNLRLHANEDQIDEDKIIVCGFSAGGHLAASLGVFWSDTTRFPEEQTRLLQKPNALILCYPVITAGEYKHARSISNLTSNKEEQGDYSLENHVTNKVPPCFIWHTMTDPSVPVENSLLWIAALRKQRIPCEAMLFPNGTHGLSLATKEAEAYTDKSLADEHIARWFPQCIDWLQNQLHM